jgi:hypothetical protein
MIPLRYLAALLAITIMIMPVTAMILEEPDDGKITPEPTLVTDKRVVSDYKYSTERLSLLAIAIQLGKEIVGIEEPVEIKDETIFVVIDGELVATIPSDSTFAGMTLHKVCLEYQYGTQLWYECEVSV